MQAVSDIIRTTLGPRSMLKMLLDASGGMFVASEASYVAPDHGPRFCLQ